MFNLLLILYILVVLFLIFFILLNSGKGSEIGALSNSNDFLSSKSSSVFLNRVIVVFALLTVFINFSINFVGKSSFYKDHKPIVDVSSYEKY